MSEYEPDTLSAPPDAPVIKWMERPPLSVGATSLAGALAGVFVLGVVTTLAAVMLGRFVAGDEG